MGTVIINGKTYVGNNISVINGKVTIDGKSQGCELSGVVEVKILEGKVENVTTDASLSCGDVLGNAKAGGSVQCNDVAGSVSCGGSCQCDSVGGSVNAGGSVRHR